MLSCSEKEKLLGAKSVMFIVFDHPTVHKNKNAAGMLYFHYEKKMKHFTKILQTKLSCV